MASPSVHANIKPLEWIIGKWVSFEADGQYPTMKNFKFIDILQFESFGHPSITYAGDSIHADSGNPIHAERGFITIKPGTNGIAFIIALISGTTLVETGTIENQKITLESTCIGRSLYFRPEFPNVVKDTRKYWLEGDVLNYSHDMETATTTKMTNHLIVKYRKA